MWTSSNWLGHSQSFLLMKKLNIFEVSSSSPWFPCKWRARARRRQRLLLYGRLLFSSISRQLMVPFLKTGSGKTASLHRIGTSSIEAAFSVKLSTCRTSTLYAFFLYYRTLWRQFCWENLLKLPNCHECTQVWSDPAGYCFRVRKVPDSSVLNNFLNETKSQIHFCCTFQFVENLIKFFVHDCFVESFLCVNEHFVSRSFKFRIHQEMLTTTQLFFQPVILNVSHNVFHIHIFCSLSDLHSELTVSMLT